ncbi:hypothetical protein ROZALSC1DRAFT_23738 [Rozella allomycis CSF55]|uniref:Uncharacterized protein n=1 Tax=Rozella allomycis (strain CSF55) TaxID=988480 RepID=A0A4P9YFH5_ROZAC|nr:hypothetical protein ROZALSC1DRAFT_23738 [Rozella allomycis CSF55]
MWMDTKEEILASCELICEFGKLKTCVVNEFLSIIDCNSEFDVRNLLSTNRQFLLEIFQTINSKHNFVYAERKLDIFKISFFQKPFLLKSLLGLSFSFDLKFFLKEIEYLTCFFEDSNVEILTHSRKLLAEYFELLNEEQKDSFLKHWEEIGSEHGILQIGFMCYFSIESVPLKYKTLFINKFKPVVFDEQITYHGIIAGEIIGKRYQDWSNIIEIESFIQKLVSWISAPPGTFSLLCAQASKSIFVHLVDHNVQLISYLAKLCLNAKSLVEKIAIVRVINLIVVKAPQCILNHVLLVIELCIKLLDPSDSLQRDSCIPFVTSALFDVVKSQKLAYGGYNGNITVYDLKTSTKAISIQGHEKQVDLVSFSPEGKHLLSLSIQDRTLKLWTLPTGLLGLLNHPSKVTRPSPPNLNNSSGNIFDPI